MAANGICRLLASSSCLVSDQEKPLKSVRIPAFRRRVAI